MPLKRSRTKRLLTLSTGSGRAVVGAIVKKELVADPTPSASLDDLSEGIRLKIRQLPSSTRPSHSRITLSIGILRNHEI